VKKNWLTSDTSGFTMIEIILVVLILSILFFSFRNIFQIKNKDIIYGQTCIEHLYGEINNFAKAGVRSQTLQSGGIQIFPDQYLIYMIPSQNTIALKYIISGTLSNYETYQLSGDIPSERYCHTSEYSVIMSW
jgi:prepilin-type N-terminal cleavage/methylation domain-containing protein